MPTEQCVRMILQAAASQAREELFVPLQKLGPILVPLLPRVTNLITRLKQKQFHAKLQGDDAKQH
jgi:hypothetical protein